jgi:Flp pilus assembly protein TadD
MAADPRRIKDLFVAALEQPDPAARRAFLDRECTDDAELRQRLDVLLQAHDEPASALNRPLAEIAPEVPDSGAIVDAPPARESAGIVIAGRYKLIEEIGAGGMGAVWMSQQTEPVKRLVALKVIKAGMDSKQVVARFEAERQALALMDHPNIARVLDAGTTATGRPYFVMELVKGVPITRYCDQQRLTPKQRLALFADVCQAVQHAHQKGIIHRDLKPSNVLVALYDDRPMPKVIDFGVAKATGQQLTEETVVTGFGDVIGTLEYMSPEQAELNQLDIDTRSDVYSLGVLLYELLTGTTPLKKKRLKEAALLEVLRLIREEEPPRPSTRLSESKDTLPSISAQRQTEPARLTKLVRGELDWIVMKALEKDRSRRYESASAFAADIGRYLADEPVQACPPSGWYRFRKFARRNKGRLAVAALVLFFLAVLGGAAGWAAWDRAARRTALAAEVGRDLDEARAFCRANRLREASAVLDHAQALAARGGAGEDLSGRVARVRTDVDMAARLEAIRLERASVKGEVFDFAGADGRYRDAFRDYGLDVMSLDAEAAAVRIEASGIKEQLLAALHDWLGVRSVIGPPDRRLLALLRRADADPWRDRLLDAFGRNDRHALKELARRPEAAAQPPTTVVLLGALLEGLDERPLAVEVLRSAQQRHPDDFWINHQLAWCLQALKPPQAGAAVRYYQAALALRPDNPGAHLNLGNALNLQGDLAGAAAEYRQALALQPANFKAHNALGTVLYYQGDLAGAIAEHRKALALKPEYASAHSNLGNALRAKGDLTGAIAEHRKALALQPDFPEVHTNLGAALRDQGDLTGAVAEHRKALALQPGLAVAHSNLGLALGDQGDWTGAVAEFRKALALKPQNAEAHNSLGAALLDQGDPAGAAAEYRKALALKPEYAEAHNNLGNALQAQGDLAGAVAEHRKALALKPNNAVTLYNLGLALSDQGDLAGAVAEYRKALALRPNYPEAHCNLGNTLLRRGEFQEALAELRRGDELGSKAPRWNYPSGAWVRRCQRVMELDGRLPDFLAGMATPENTDEQVRLALLCWFKRLHRAASRFFEGAFSQPGAAPYVAALRYNAACCAALAGCGQGKDADQLDEKEYARLRRQALDWLRADLEAWGSLLNKQPEKGRWVIVRTLRNWQVCPDLAGVRGEKALARLPEIERQPWRELWADVTDTLARAQGEKPPKK